MPVDVAGDPDRRVSERIGNRLQWNVGCDQQRGGGVPHSVRGEFSAENIESHCLDESVASVESKRCADRRCEDKIAGPAITPT